MKHFLTLVALIVFTFPLLAQPELVTERTSVYFASASAALNSSERSRLNAFSEQLAEWPDYTLKVEAFTDEIGTETYNEALAQRRAATVIGILKQQGIVATSSEVLTHGEQHARKNTAGDTERRQDRRVDLVVTTARWPDTESAIATARAEQQQRITLADPTKQQTCKGAEGGVFVFPPNTLVYADGQPASGPVTIELTEAYELPDMLIAGLTTTSGGLRLETGGMFCLKAKDQGGETLLLKPGATVKASIPAKYFNEEMQLFRGRDFAEDGTPRDWALIEGSSVRPTAEELLPKPTVGLDTVTYRRKIERLVLMLGDRFQNANRGCDRFDPFLSGHGAVYFNWLLDNPAPDTPHCVNPATYPVRKAPAPLDTATLVFQPRGMDKILMSKKKRAVFTAQARRRKMEIHQRRLQAYKKSVAFRDSLPAINARKRATYQAALASWLRQLKEQQVIAIEAITQATFAIAQDRYRDQLLRRTEEINLFEEALDVGRNFSGRTEQTVRYFFNLNGLGWVNCDTFLPGEGTRTKVLASIPYSSAVAKVMLIPTDRPSALAFERLKNSTWKNRGIPQGISCHIVAFEVIEGKLVLAHRYIDKLAGGRMEELVYEPVAAKALKQRLAELLSAK